MTNCIILKLCSFKTAAERAGVLEDLLATLLLAELAIRGMFGYEQSIWHHAKSRMDRMGEQRAGPKARKMLEDFLAKVEKLERSGQM
jgi:hypothetical protein